MLRIQMIGLALMALLTVNVVTAGSAMAEELHQWLLFHTQSGVHLLLSAPITVHFSRLLLYEDSGTGVSLHCRGFDTGIVGPHGLGLVKSFTLELLGTKSLILCLYGKVPSFTCKEDAMPDIEGINFPWRTEIVLHGTELRDLILAEGSGAPGYRVTCINVLGGTTTDTCEEETGIPGSISVTNVAGGVLGTFDAVTPRAKCSVGGAKTGKAEGTVLAESPSSTLSLLVSFGS
jgi:hypothetical protein